MCIKVNCSKNKISNQLFLILLEICTFFCTRVLHTSQSDEFEHFVSFELDSPTIRAEVSVFTLKLKKLTGRDRRVF